MKVLFVIIIAILILANFFCFYQSRKYLNKVKGNDEASNNNYNEGMKYIKASVVVSLVTCLVGVTFVLVENII